MNLSIFMIMVNSNLKNSDSKQSSVNWNFKTKFPTFQNGDTAREIVESNVKIVDDHYEIPVSLKSEVVKNWPNNYHNALNRT